MSVGLARSASKVFVHARRVLEFPSFETVRTKTVRTKSQLQQQQIYISFRRYARMSVQDGITDETTYERVDILSAKSLHLFIVYFLTPRDYTTVGPSVHANYYKSRNHKPKNVFKRAEKVRSSSFH